ncbi:MAG: hypothetical protein IKV80_07130 [Bacteroidales bacterium]|nr:hypothetical protein [Bacteroidales bacterium]
MLKAERNGMKINTEIGGTGEVILSEFASMCGTLANNMIEMAGMTEEEVTQALALTMARGIASRGGHVEVK